MHVKGDAEVCWEELKVAQKKLNGHVAMMIKNFQNWGQLGSQRGEGDYDEEVSGILPCTSPLQGS